MYVDYEAFNMGKRDLRSRRSKKTRDIDERIKQAWDDLDRGSITAEELIERVKFPDTEGTLMMVPQLLIPNPFLEPLTSVRVVPQETIDKHLRRTPGHMKG